MITSSQSFEIYEILNRYFKNEKDAKALVKEIESVIDTRFQGERDRLATKEDVANVKSEILKWMIVLFAPFYVGMIVFLIKQFV